MIEGVLQVSELQVRDIMIPRSQMVVVEEEHSVQEMLPTIIQSAHSRFPVIGDSRDEVVGILLAKDLLRYFGADDTQKVPLRKLPGVMRESMVLVGAIFMILGLSLASTSYLIGIEAPQRLFEFVSQFIGSETGFLIALLLFLLAVGAMLDIFSAIVLVVPLIVPVALQYGVDPVHLGIVFLAAMELGYMTPPVGLNLFISSFRFEKDIAEVYSATVPFLLVLLVITALAIVRSESLFAAVILTGIFSLLALLSILWIFIDSSPSSLSTSLADLLPTPLMRWAASPR